MNQEIFIQRLSKKYPYMYKLVPKDIWEWIYRNYNDLIKQYGYK